jgi:hypothetical protein
MRQHGPEPSPIFQYPPDGQKSFHIQQYPWDIVSSQKLYGRFLMFLVLLPWDWYTVRKTEVTEFMDSDRLKRPSDSLFFSKDNRDSI